MQIAKHTFFISGGSSGLGKATAMHLAAQDANVIIADLNSDAGQDLAGQLGSHALFVNTDVTNSDAIDTAIKQAVNQFGALHGLINCAGILSAERLLKKDRSLFDLTHFRQCIETNLIGAFNTIRLCGRILSENPPEQEGERGVIINTASIAAYEGQIGQAAYAAAKAGIIGMTLPLARELGKFGIRVMTIAPGVFNTPLFANLSEQKLKELEHQAPFPSRLGKPVEYAGLVRHIIENPMLNGEVIRLDGGMRLH